MLSIDPESFMSIRCFSLNVEFWGPGGPDRASGGGRPRKSTYKKSDRIEPKLSGLIDNILTKIKIPSRIIYQSFQGVIKVSGPRVEIPDPKFRRREIACNSVWAQR